jgi:hypothetical protein
LENRFCCISVRDAAGEIPSVVASVVEWLDPADIGLVALEGDIQ